MRAALAGLLFLAVPVQGEGLPEVRESLLALDRADLRLALAAAFEEAPCEIAPAAFADPGFLRPLLQRAIIEAGGGPVDLGDEAVYLAVAEVMDPVLEALETDGTLRLDPATGHLHRSDC